MRRTALFLASAILAAASIALPVTAHSDEQIYVKVRATRGARVPQGLPLGVTVKVENRSASLAEVTVTLALYPADKPSRAMQFQREFVSVSPGSVASFETDVNPAQWFRKTGSYVVALGSAEVSSQPLTFEVTRSPIQLPRFKDVTAQAGLETSLGGFTCGNWTAGAAWGDVDGDDDLDLYVPRRDAPAQLWVNTEGEFSDQAEARGLSAPAGSAAVFADYDNDGDQDLYVAGDGPNFFYRNEGGYFLDLTDEAGVGDDGPSQSASWGDYDSDGFLDLYVTTHGRCPAPDEKVYFTDHLFHNEGDGSFTDQTSLLHAEGSTRGAGFQAAWFDYDHDLDADLYLANDYWGPEPEANLLWRNDGEAGFKNVSVESGSDLAINSMGVGIGDYDRDGDLDLAISKMAAPVLLANQGDGSFAEVAESAGIARDDQSLSSMVIGWGTTFVDLNNDGWQDLYVAAGRLAPFTFQPNLVFTNYRNGTFLDHSAPSRADDEGVGRGVAVADFDRDGRVDMFVVNQAGDPVLYRNVTKPRKNWIQVEAIGSVSNRDSCGAWVTIRTRSGKQTAQVFCGSTSLGSGSDKVIHFGLGRAKRVRKIVVQWPSGRRAVIRGVKADRRVEVKEPPD